MDFAKARRNMVDCQLRTFDVHDRAVLAAMAAVPRERFAPAGQEELAYLDRTLAEGEGGGEPRYLLSAMILGRLVQALAIRAGDRALDLGGTGYGAAVLRQLGAEVATAGPGAAGGAPGEAPFDAILVNGAVAARPEALLGQLADGGRLACLLQDGRTCRAALFVRSGEATGHRILFDAAAPLLPAFSPAPEFVF